jgi:hypothetical protein
VALTTLILASTETAPTLLQRRSTNAEPGAQRPGGAETRRFVLITNVSNLLNTVGRQMQSRERSDRVALK